MTRNQDYSVSKAKKAISDYKKAVGHAEGLAELTVFYCESCRDFLGFCSVDDEVYFNALVRMFEQALKWIRQLDSDKQEHYLERLDSVHYQADDWGWGVSSDMGELMAEYGFAEKCQLLKVQEELKRLDEENARLKALMVQHGWYTPLNVPTNISRFAQIAADTPGRKKPAILVELRA